jgi:SAM-dependent methyltransferase
MTEAATYTAHNVCLDDGRWTLPQAERIVDSAWFGAARRVLALVYPQGPAGRTLVDLGCLEGGYALEFARMGFNALGIEARASNFAACEAVRAAVQLAAPAALRYVRDDVRHLASHTDTSGAFDVTWCCGLFYHLDEPNTFLRLLGQVTRRVLILNTHFAPAHEEPYLSPLMEHDGARGRWYREFADGTDLAAQETSRWASWGNEQSFWMTRESILQTMSDGGFTTVFEQYDPLAPDIAQAMTTGAYAQHHRGVFVGIKSL